jgi:hypothetical protein
VVYVPNTGHVVGAVNASGGVAPTDAAALVGDALPLRLSVDGEVATLPLLTRQLALHQADDEPRVFEEPLGFGVEMAGEEPKPTLVRLKPELPELAFTTNSLVVTVQVADPTRDTPVLALIADGQDVHERPWAIPAGDDSVEIPVTVPDGTYVVLALVAGWTGVLTTETKETRP